MKLTGNLVGTGLGAIFLIISIILFFNYLNVLDKNNQRNSTTLIWSIFLFLAGGYIIFIFNNF